MRIAILGNHPHGVAMARALVESGRHQLEAYTAPIDDALPAGPGQEAKKVTDLEEVLADPRVEAVVVAGTPANRPAQLRRALQSERHVLCVHPADDSPEIAYEAGMIQTDTGYVLLPLLPELLHPALGRLADFVRCRQGEQAAPVGRFRFLEVERAAPEEVLLDADVAGRKPSLPGWDLLRLLGGELAEVTAFAEHETLGPGEPVVVSGRFMQGGMFHQTLIPNYAGAPCRLTVVGDRGRAALLFPQGFDGPSFLTWREGTGELHEEAWETWDPWPALVEEFEAALRVRAAATEPKRAAGEPAVPPRPPRVSWQDEVRCLELDDAARRGVERRRSSVMEYQEATEEVGFKGTMTLVGCAMVWLVPLVLLLTRLFPPLGWVLIPLLALALFGFLGAQLLRYFIPARPERAAGKPK